MVAGGGDFRIACSAVNAVGHSRCLHLRKRGGRASMILLKLWGDPCISVVPDIQACFAPSMVTNGGEREAGMRVCNSSCTWREEQHSQLSPPMLGPNTCEFRVFDRPALGRVSPFPLYDSLREVAMASSNCSSAAGAGDVAANVGHGASIPSELLCGGCYWHCSHVWPHPWTENDPHQRRTGGLVKSERPS